MPVLCHAPQGASCVVPDGCPLYCVMQKKGMARISLCGHISASNIQANWDRMQLIPFFKIKLRIQHLTFSQSRGSNEIQSSDLTTTLRKESDG